MAATAPNPPRWIEYHRLDQVTPALANPKGHDDDFLDDKIQEFGFVEPSLLDQRTGRLVVGHGRLESLIRQEAAGGDPPEGIVVDKDGRWTMPVVHGWASDSDEQADKYLIVSNRSPERGGWKPDELAQMLARYEQDVAGFALGAGFDDEEYRALIQEAGILGDQEAGFLADLEDLPPVDGDAAPARDTARTGTDVVDFRLAMTQAQRDEAILILRQQAGARNKDTLVETLLEILRGLTA